jgi:hypothetical protein
LLLGDGELVIQALVRPEIHCFVDGGSVYEGCYVRVDKFELGWLRGGDGGKVVYLVVGDMVTVGWNDEYMGILSRERGVEMETDEVVKEVGTEGFRDDGELEALLQLMAEEEESGEAAVAASDKEVKSCPNEGPKPCPPKPSTPKPPAEKKDPGLDYLSDSDDAFETLGICTERVEQRRVTTIATAPDPRDEPQAAVPQLNQHQPPNTNKPRPWTSNDPTQPIKLTLLRAIPNLPYKQNWMVNVLVIVVSLSDVEPSHLAPYLQRTARLADPSTLKHIHLTVVLDPQSFTPAVGSVVLLRGVKNHMYDGGSLRKYVSDRPKNGMSWWVQHPETLGWCDEDVERLRVWWEGDGRRSDGGL